MASETSDLTFVRCPSCRSLVPASATRCRICNNPLDSLNKEEPDASRNTAGNRVRQKTITASPQEVEAALAAAQGSQPPPTPEAPPQNVAPIRPAKVEPPPTAAVASAAAEEDFDDPLGAYLQQVESGSGGSVGQGATPSSGAAVSVEQDDDDLFDLDIFDEPPMEEPVQRREQPKPVASPESDRFEAPVRESKPPPAPEPPKPVRPAEPPKPERPREARPPQPMRPSGGQGGEQRKPQEPQRQQPRSDRMQEQRQGRSGQPMQPRSPEQQRGGRHDERDNRRAERPSRPEAPPQREIERREEPGERAYTAGPKTGKMRPGRLFGWLVSYENPDGRAIELRSGKFFVTSSSIKGSDLVLEDPSISAPHALMSISDSGLLVQDLMSDHGVYVRSAEDRDFRREDGVIRVNHGDWLRFGEVEFLVIIVP